MSKNNEMKDVIVEADSEQEGESRDQPGSLPESPIKTSKTTVKPTVDTSKLGLQKSKTGASPDASPARGKSPPSRGVAKLRAATKAVGLGLRLQGDAATPAAERPDPSADHVTKSQVEKMISIAVSDAVERFELEGKNLTADKHAFETKLRRDMQGLVSPLVDQGVKHKE